MDLSFTAEDSAFRDEVRQFLATSIPDSLRDKLDQGAPLLKSDYVGWQKILYEKGWIAPGWPKEAGGCGWNATQQYIFNLELGLSGAPRPIPFGLNMVGPVIYSFGNEAQKAQHLPGILKSDVWWAQGYSEPGAGSDLASLRMAAVRDGDHYILNGTKLWTTMAHWADWIFCLVRTSNEAKPQEGISFLLVDITTPGISIDPVITIDGEHHVNQVTFEDVRVPAENRVGKEGAGWTCAKFLLANERQAITDLGAKKRMLQRLRALAAQIHANGKPLSQDPDFSRKLADLDIQVSGLEYTELRFLDAQLRGEERGFEPSILKVRGTELQQALSELYVEALGYFALPYPTNRGDHGSNMPESGPRGAANGVAHFLYSRAATIYGGTNEIQKNIMAKLLLRA
ncbi:MULTISPECIES: acyl-CoA dehydrogenase family protein [unclassified Iodidimonas]|jgi:alkylation response protein AidB-like acyl-CoA dehydrogenase|uniref:acyl-CoA dehydrogenase family protein n=1 Tax=unclassified Iodidimonas TaxID=2626145 RepID=UPI0024832452|nr:MULTISPECIES: acyl-CoA dehydrogenase family protein [unclassified Iodidimonas]